MVSVLASDLLLSDTINERPSRFGQRHMIGTSTPTLTRQFEVFRPHQRFTSEPCAYVDKETGLMWIERRIAHRMGRWRLVLFKDLPNLEASAECDREFRMLSFPLPIMRRFVREPREEHGQAT